MEDNKELVEETENTELTAEEIENVESEEEVEKSILEEFAEEEAKAKESEEVIEDTTEEEVESEEDRINRLVNQKVDEILPKKLARKEAKMRKEYAEKYGKLETVVKAGLETDNVEDAVQKLTDFYTSRGIRIPTEPQYSDKDLEVLANAEADDIISGGYEDIVEEVERLAAIGPDNMSNRDKKVFMKLANERQRIEDAKELASIGVNADDLDTEEFKKYSEKLNPNLSLKEKYEMYQESKPKKEIKTIGSMKNIPTDRGELKDFYTYEEAIKFTEEDFEKNPKLEKIVEASMLKWK